MSLRSPTSFCLFVIIGTSVITLLTFVCAIVYVSTNTSPSLRANIENEQLLLGDHYEESIRVSSIGSAEFECLGTCYCEDSERRSTIPFISRSITYLVLSISSSVAYRNAQTYFENVCKEQLSSECHLSVIKSSVDGCSKSIDNESKEDIMKRNVRKGRVYFCYGNCVENLKLRIEETIKQFSPLECGNLRREGEVIVYEEDMANGDNTIPKSKQAQKFSSTARLKFQKLFLNAFCRRRSETEYEVLQIYIKKRNLKEYENIVMRTSSGCVGGNHLGARQNIKCRQIDPKPTDTSRKYWDKRFWDEKRDWDEGRKVL